MGCDGIAEVTQALGQSDAMVSWLHAVVLHAQSRPGSVSQSLLVDCFAAWVRLGCLHESSLPQSQNADLASFVLSGLHSSDDGETLPETSSILPLISK